MIPLLKQAMYHLIQGNPDIANNPRNQALLNTLASGDQEKIRQTAMNLCRTYGCSVEQAGQEAVQWLQGIAGIHK